MIEVSLKNSFELVNFIVVGYWLSLNVKCFDRRVQGLSDNIKYNFYVLVKELNSL